MHPLRQTHTFTHLAIPAGAFDLVKLALVEAVGADAYRRDYAHHYEVDINGKGDGLLLRDCAIYPDPDSVQLVAQPEADTIPFKPEKNGSRRRGRRHVTPGAKGELPAKLAKSVYAPLRGGELVLAATDKEPGAKKYVATVYKESELQCELRWGEVPLWLKKHGRTDVWWWDAALVIRLTEETPCSSGCLDSLIPCEKCGRLNGKIPSEEDKARIRERFATP